MATYDATGWALLIVLGLAWGALALCSAGAMLATSPILWTVAPVAMVLGTVAILASVDAARQFPLITWAPSGSSQESM